MTNTIRRDDIQGLRAVGAVLVAIYHIWIGRVSGGVDVFFLVSGFLLVGSLGRQLVSTSQVDIITFVTRLFYRILPNSLFIITFVLATAWLWIPETRWDTTLKEVVASALYVQNWGLAFNSVDYLARDTIGSPMQHFWAMSAQVQALILSGIVLFLAALVLKTIRVPATYSVVLSILIGLFLLSLSYSIIRTNANQAFTYFDTLARVWEFAAGGIVALVLPRISLSESVRFMLGWFGLLAIVACGLVLDVSTIFPGYAALWPIGAAALVLLAGAGPTSRWSANALLGSKPLKWLGDNSYALYLWHWPLLVMYLSLNSRISVGFWVGLLILGGSIVLAYLTTTFVEGRFKTPRPSPLRTVLGTAFVVGIVGLGAFVWNHIDQANRDEQRSITFDASIHLGASALTLGGYDAGDATMYPQVLRAKPDRSDIYKDGCFQGFLGAELLSCEYGGDNATKTAILVGSSHAAHWVPAVRGVLEQQGDWRLFTYLKAQCPFTTQPLWGEPAAQASCRTWNKRALATILESKPDLVFLVGTLTQVATSNDEEVVPQAFRDQWWPILNADIQVVALRDTPRYGVDVADCVAVNGRDSDRCIRPRDELLAEQNPTLALPEASQLISVDLSDSFCTMSICPPVIGNVLVYPDRGHVTRTYMHTLVPRLYDMLEQYL